MSATDLLEPTGPQRGLRSTRKPTVYRPEPGAHPRHLSRESDGVYGWVRMEPVEAPEPPPSPPPPSRSEGAPVPERPHTIHDLEGYDQRPNPMLARTPAQFVQALRDFRAWSGDWSYRQLVAFSGGTPRSTFHAMLNSDQLPKFPLVALFITACGGDEDEVQRWTTAWRRLRMAAEGPGRAETTEEAVQRLTSRD
ncbi:hypothetical protein ACFQZ2_06005 [Streptomonospora algeriensis]|uniref:XRE family transcriptional regulator n=1 Tax=Streptomonospora algeriensis TaxID=995084 RepID=A0ABW3BB45_9ACTN